MDITNKTFEEDKKIKAAKTKIRAKSMRERAEEACEKQQAIMDSIPFGQPILTDHYSAKKHRRALEKQQKALEMAQAYNIKANELEQRKPTTAIDSTDPLALDKLNQKLQFALEYQIEMKAVNKIIRNKKTSKADNDLQIVEKFGYSEDEIAMLYHDSGDLILCGYSGYSLSNNLNKINNIKKRIAAITQLQNEETLDIDTGKYRIDISNGRIRIIFADGKPSDQVRAEMRKHAFLWAPTRGAWVRKITKNAIAATKRLEVFLEKTIGGQDG